MNIEDLLSVQDVVVDLRASGKTPLLQDLAERAAKALAIDAHLIAAELLKREGLGSTGVGHGIAIPHARLAEVQRPFGLIARLKRPIDFEAIDGAPVDIVFLLLQPASSSSDLNALATVARKLREPERLERMRTAADGEALYRELTR